MDKVQILSALRAFVDSRPGLDFSDYGHVSLYRSDYRKILQHKHDAHELIRAIAWRQSITAEDILDRATNGRLTITADGTVDYITGQYYPVEYRAAVCSLLASVLWDYWRCTDIPELNRSARDIQIAAKFNLSRGVFNRWFKR